MEEVRRERRVAALWLTIDREARRNALNEDQPSIQRRLPHLQGLRVFRRGVPFTQTFYRWKFDDNDSFQRRAAFDQICDAAAD